MAIIPALIPVIAETTLASAAASVALTVPSGYELLFLEWHDVYSDHADAQSILLTFNGDGGGNYDHSRQVFGTASSTTNAATSIDIAIMGDTDDKERHSNGLLTIFNRAGAEKIVIGTTVTVDKGGANDEDVQGRHNEAKWRTTAGVITTVTITPSAGNFTAGSKFILRGLRTDRAPALGSQDICQFIGSHTVSGTEASVTLPTIPAGYGMLWLFWHDIKGDNSDAKALNIRFNADAGGNYDHSHQRFGTASSTTNADTGIQVGSFADDDGADWASNGFAAIFNRALREKVIISTSNDIETAGANAHDVRGSHTEAKWRNTSDPITSLTVLGGGSNTIAGKFWLIGVKIP